MIRSFIVILITFAYILLLGPPVLLHAMIIKNADLLYRVGQWGARMGVWLAGARLEVHGLEKIPLGRAVVFMANHQGNCDPPALLSILPPVLVLLKKELFRIPILGRAMRLCDYIPVDRKHRERAVQAVEKAVVALKTGRSFLVFPEGTRSPDGRLQPFKKGVFVMAIQAGAPIVPISISGSTRIMRKGEFAMHPGLVRITLHDPVPTEKYTLEQRDELMEEVRRAILSGLTQEEWPISP